MDAQVIVVGAGPVGLMLAGQLHLGGAEVLVLERLAEPTTESRASTLHARTMEILDQLGLRESLGTPPNDGMGHFGGLPLDLGGLRSPYAGQWKVPQTRVEELLQEWASDLGADIRRGHELRAVTVTEDHVEVETVGSKRFRASYLVGCDGEQSTVRRLAGFEFPGTDASKELLRADVDGIEVPNRRFQRFPAGLAIAGRRADGVTRVMVHEFGKKAVPRTEEPEFAEIVGAWARVTGEDISSGTPLWVNAFGDASRQATHYRKGRVLLAGDAAHVQMPVGGQALNLGLQDAVNLGWKLAAQVAGTAPDGLLDSYHDERHPVGARILTNIAAQALLLLGGPEAEAPRTILGELLTLDRASEHLAAMISGLDISYETGDHPLIGARMPYWELENGATTALGALLDFAGGVDAAPWEDRVRTVRARPPADGSLAGINAVLVRPDGHIAWIDPGPTDLHTALNRWFGVPRTVTSGATS